MFCRKAGSLLFEVKSLAADNELSQMRSGIAQLYEYRYREDLEKCIAVARVLKEAAAGAVDRALPRGGSGHSRALAGFRRTARDHRSTCCRVGRPNDAPHHVQLALAA